MESCLWLIAQREFIIKLGCLSMNRGLKHNLKQWITKVFRSDKKSKNFMNEIARKITACDMKESKHQL